MALDTYANLKTSITAWTKRADLASYLSDFVTLAEARIFTDLKVKEMEARTEYTPTSRYLATPTGMRTIRRVIAKSNPEVELLFTSPDGIHALYDTSTGTPSHYTVLGSEIEFNRVPNVAVEIVYFAEPAALSDSATSNAILSAYPQVYLAASMMEAASFTHDDGMLAKWQALYSAAVQSANSKSSQFHTSGPMAVNRA